MSIGIPYQGAEKPNPAVYRRFYIATSPQRRFHIATIL
jgi:hypothetical protein